MRDNMKYAVISGEYLYADKLRDYGFVPLKTCNNADIARPVAYHADMNIAKIEDKIFIAERQSELIGELEIIGADLRIVGGFSPDYPNDVQLNIAQCGKTAIINPRTALPEIVDALNQKQYEIHSVKQGYSGCSVLFINEKAAVTTDSGIYASLHNELDLLLISPLGISLKGYDYGFIGGSAKLLGDDFVLFFGDISEHGDYGKIKRFLHAHGVKYDCLPGKLCDIGGVIMI